MATRDHILGVDFGTSNSAAGYVRDGAPRLVEMAPGRDTLPTTFFFDFDTRRTLIGDPAVQALLDGAEGRFMRALKRVLGTSLMHEERQILNRRLTFVDIIARFLRDLKTRAEAEAGVTFPRALSGRPVVFHKAGDRREAQAEADLRACYLAAGFEDVAFMAEPEAAAVANGALEASGQIGLIVDIGGGTSDFTVFRSTDGGAEILASHGVRIGGTDFDRSISTDHVMPLLGKGSALRNAIGPGVALAPNAIFSDLATWEKIPFLYNARTRRQAAEMARQAIEPARLARLASVLDDEIGHDVAFAVERGKIATNASAEASAIDLGVIERGLAASLSPESMTTSLTPFAATLRDAAEETLRRANLCAEDVARVVYVGGSSRMRIVTDTIGVMTPGAARSSHKVFTAVAEGLAIAAGRR